jgi:hypothetical protein
MAGNSNFHFHFTFCIAIMLRTGVSTCRGGVSKSTACIPFSLVMSILLN